MKKKKILTDQNMRTQIRIGSDWYKEVFTDENKHAQKKIGKCNKK